MTHPDDAEWGNECWTAGPDCFVSADRSGDRFACYLLASSTGKSRYVGMTCDLPRRIRQHNREIKGGAKATARGGPWRIAAVLAGFADMHEALTAEWRLKRIGRGRPGPGGVLSGLEALLSVPRASGVWGWTSTSRYDIRAAGLSLHVAAEFAGHAPGLIEAARNVGWKACSTDAIDPSAVHEGLAYRQAEPALAPAKTRGTCGRGDRRGDRRGEQRKTRRKAWWT